MTEKEKLKIDIAETIEIIESNKKSSEEIHDLCVDLYKRYSDLPINEFKTKQMFLDHKKSIEISANVVSLEFRGLLNNKEVETSDNYFQVKRTLQGMLLDVSR